MSDTTVTKLEKIYASIQSGIVKNTFTTEIAINDVATMGPVANLPPFFFGADPASAIGRTIHVHARGILSSTATPTYAFNVRLGASGSIAGPIILGSAALTTGSGVTNQPFTFEGDFVLTSLGTTLGTAVGRGIGSLKSGGFASPFDYVLWGGSASPGTISTVDVSITNYVNLTVTCSASSASNSVTLQSLIVIGY